MHKRLTRTIGAAIFSLGIVAFGCTGDDADPAASGDDAARSDVSPGTDASRLDSGGADAGAGPQELELPPRAEAEYTPPGPPIPRLTTQQIRNAVRDLVGADVTLPPIVEADLSEAGFEAVGAGLATVSPRGAESFEQAAYAIAEQALAPERRDRISPCEPPGDAETFDRECAADFLTDFGRLVWRRPLTEEELTQLLAIAEASAGILGGHWEGMEYPVAALFQSPSFLFRREIGAPDPSGDGAWRYSSYEMASRLSFLLWNTPPDRALLDAAEAGELVESEGLFAHAARMVEDDRVRFGIRGFFSELLELDELDELHKDTTVYTQMSSELGASAREETLLLLEHIILDQDGDYRDFLTTTDTFVDRKLASIYAIVSPTREGFARTSIPPWSGRRGFLGHLSFLALQSHPTSSSATLRGKFVRERLLCMPVPPPPADVDTSIPEVSGEARTLRERVAEHLTNPACAGCHTRMDPIGLGLENFDGLGVWRDTDNGAEIDATGDLDGAAFADAWELADAVRSHEQFAPCLVQNLYRYATGTVEERDDAELLDELTARFVSSGHRVRQLLIELVMSPAFRTVAPMGTE